MFYAISNHEERSVMSLNLRCPWKMRKSLKIIPPAVVVPLFFLIVGFSGDDTTGFLRVRGDGIIDAASKPVLLQGFNVAFKDFKGVLGESDIRKIADTGANSIRLILEYRDFESSPLEYNLEGFSLLDLILNWCEKYRIYVILDMHLAPGIQNPHDFVVHRERSYKFWQSEEHQERFYSLWSEIARRYADRRIIAGYDLLNEGVPPDADEYFNIINRVAKQIRRYDKNHILIVQEAILPDRRKMLSLIEDDNTVYSIHFFYPPRFTFYTTTTDRTITTYPGEMVTYGGKIGEAATPPVTGSSDWRRLVIETTPPEGAEILMVNVSSDGNHGAVWFDDVSLEVDGHPVDLPAPLVPNNSFEIDYPGISWNTEGRCAMVTREVSRSGGRSLSFIDCRTPARARSSPIEVKRGVYSLTAWVKSRDATGDNRISLSWHKRKSIKSIDRKALIERLDYALSFKRRYDVPIYVGEFTVHANPSRESVINYLKDILDIMRDNGLHWSYWTYYSEYPGIGIYTGNAPSLSRPKDLEVLESYMDEDGYASNRASGSARSSVRPRYNRSPRRPPSASTS